MNKYDKRRKKVKRIQKMKRLKDVPLKAWCDCQKKAGSYHETEVDSSKEFCTNCGHYVQWSKEKPRPTEFRRLEDDVEMNYLEDYTTDIGISGFKLHHHEVEDNDAI